MQRFLTGWGLLGTISLALGAMCLGIAAAYQFDVEGIRLTIRATARTSLVLFLLAYTAAALYRLWPSAWSGWQRQNRRYLGVSFAVSHLLHAIGILAFAVMDPLSFQQDRTIASYIVGGIGYAFIVAMAATSFDAAVTAIGQRTWKLLHRAGIYYLWLQFVISFGMRAGAKPWYWGFVVVLGIALVLRIAAWYRARARSAQVAGQTGASVSRASI